jgi:hypothetical protein
MTWPWTVSWKWHKVSCLRWPILFFFAVYKIKYPYIRAYIYIYIYIYTPRVYMIHFVLHSCDRASWHVTVHRDMWPCIVTRDRASWHVTVHRDMWPCIVTCGRASWHVTVHRDMWPCIVTNFFTIKQTGCTNFWNLIWKWNSTCFGQFLCPSSGVIHCTLSNSVCHTGL